MAEEKDDFIGKRVNDVKKIFGLAERDFMALMLIISILGNIALVWLYIDQNKSLNKQIVEEVKRQVAPAVETKVDDKLNGVVEGVDAIKNRLNNVIDTVERRIQK